MAPGDDLLSAVGLDFGKAGYVDPVRGQVLHPSVRAASASSYCVLPLLLPVQAGVDRMAAQLSLDKERNKTFHRRRLVNEEDGVDYINEKNRRQVVTG